MFPDLGHPAAGRIEQAVHFPIITAVPDLPVFCIGLANHYQFRPGARLTNGPVESRMLLWGCAGQGTVVVDGTSCRLGPEDFVVLPWHHRITYQADRRNPFLVAGIHLVPCQDGVPVLRVNHNGEDRQPDPSLPGLEGLRHGTFSLALGLRPLAEYIVTWFRRPLQDQGQSCRLAQVLIDELRLALAAPTLAPESRHPGLERALAAVIADLARPIDVDGMARIAGVSPATLNRLFRQRFSTPPARWILHLRMERAAQLLTTTGDAVTAIARQVGFLDPHHFARTFRRHHGVTALAWRQRHALVLDPPGSRAR